MAVALNNFFGGPFFGGGFFGIGTKGSGDNERGTYKPTGILHRPKKKDVNERVEVRLDESREIQAEIAGRLAREFGEENASLAFRNIQEMTQDQIDREIGYLLRRKLNKDNDEMLLLLLVAASA